MPPTTLLIEIVTDITRDSEFLDEEQLRGLWHQLVGDELAYHHGADYFVEYFQHDLSGAGLDISLGTWKLDTKTAAVQSGVVAAVAAALLQLMGYDDLPGYVLPSVIPILLQIKSVQLSAWDNQMIVTLKEIRDDDGKFRTVDKIYSSLPKRDQRRISKIDLAAFLERVRETGHSTKSGGKYAITPNGQEPKLMLRWS